MLVKFSFEMINTRDYLYQYDILTFCGNDMRFLIVNGRAFTFSSKIKM